LEQEQTWISGGGTSGSAGAASLVLAALALPSFAGVTGAAFLPEGVRGRLPSTACKSASNNNWKHATILQDRMQILLACIGGPVDTRQLLMTVSLTCLIMCVQAMYNRHDLTALQAKENVLA